jgi:hypothetical protein
MTYNELKNILDSLSEEQLNRNVTFYLPYLDEYMGIGWDTYYISEDNNDVVDPGTLIISIGGIGQNEQTHSITT